MLAVNYLKYLIIFKNLAYQDISHIFGLDKFIFQNSDWRVCSVWHMFVC